MALNDTINQDLTKALKAKDDLRVSCLRMLKAAVKNREVSEGRKLEDTEIEAVISSLVRKGKEAVKEFRNGGREDLAVKEEREIGVFYEYLPRQLTPEEIENILKEVISDLSVQSPKDLGKVMKVAMAKMAGQVQGKEVNEIARKLLN
jgi:uncharacterized protein YqeY